MGDDSEWMKLPTEQKVEHKVWKARVSGYEELVKQLRMITDEKSPEFNKYAGLQKKFVTDSNAIAQEKAMEVVEAYAQNAGMPILGRIVQDVANGIVAKCLNSARAKTKEKGMEVLLLYIEAEKQEGVTDALMAGLSNKQPKIVAGCVMCLREALRCFGPKTITVKPLVKQFQRLLEDRDKTVREEGKALVVEVYRWIGAPIKPQLANLKPVQVAELEAEFESLPPTKPQQERFLRSQQDLKAKMEEQAAAGGGEEDEGDGGDEAAGGEAEVDAYDLMEPVEIIAKMPKDFYDKIEMKKWQERKEVLEALKKLTESPRHADGDYGDVMRALKKVITKDTNVMLVTLAAKIVTDFANGLRKKFSSHAAGCIDCLLEKFREKKVMVVAAMREAVDACFPATNLDAISESIVEYLGHKTPSVKAEAAGFLARCFSKSTTATLPKKLLKLFATPLMKLTADSVPDVRENAFIALGTAMKVVGEKHIMPFIVDMDNIKQGKIKEACDKAELMTITGKPRGGGAVKKAATPAPAAPAKAAAPKPGGPPKAAAAKKAKPEGKKKGPPSKAKKGGGGADKEEALENVLSDEAVEDKMATIIPAESLAGLSNANWKERLASIEKFMDVVRPMPRDDIPCQACVRTITKKPGLKENNFQVMKLKVQLIAFLATNSKFSKRSAECCITDLVDKVGDVKNGGEVQEALLCIADACTLEYTSQNVIDYAFSQKNPKNQSESINWLTKALKEFGLKVNVKPLLQHIKKAFAHTNPAVRTAAIGLVGVMYLYMGSTLRVFFEDEKPALLAQIDDEIEKMKDEKPPAPTRGLSKKGQAAEEDNDEDEEEDGDGGGGGGINVADLVPRTDISDKITDEIIEQMADKNWKIRNESIQRVMTILNEAKFITANIGALPDALKLRLGDSNKILVGHTLTICQTLATAMGPHVKAHIQIVGPGIVMCCGDSKPQIRANAVSTLNQWVEQTGLSLLFQGETISDTLKVENPNLRTELLGWLASVLPSQKKLPNDELKLCIPHIFSCLEDRNAGVRAKAQEVLVPFMIHVGYDAFARQAGKLKPASKDAILKLLEKARADVPAKPAKAPKAAAAPAPASAPPGKGKAKVVKPEPPKDDWEEEPMEKAAPKGVKGGKGKVAVKKPPMTAKTAAKMAAAEDDVGPVIKANNGKEQRFKDEKNMKVFKWNFTAPRGEFVEQLRTQMEPTFSKQIITQLFHTDFKMHIKAMERLQEAIHDTDATIANCDLILKWLTLRFFDTNTSMLLKALEYIQAVFESLAENDYHLYEQEAVSFIPYLVNKVGDPKDIVRKAIRAIFKLIGKVYPSSKLFNFIMDGLKSKNSKQRTECLDELGLLIEIYGINVCQPSPAQSLKIIAGQISDRDNSVRSGALNTIVIAYHILGEAVYKYVGNISDKDQGMLEERIKRSAKTRPATAPAKVSPEVDRQKLKTATVVKKNPAQERSSSANRGQQQQQSSKARRALGLAMSDDESGDEGLVPQLEEHNLDFLEKPIELPTTRMRPPSPSMKLLSTSVDAKSAIDMVIAHIASNNITSSIQALAQIDEVLKDSNKAELLTDHVDQIIVVCTLQLRMAYTKHMSDSSPKARETVVRLYKALIASLVSLFECGTLAQNATCEVLKDLTYNLLVILLDQRLSTSDDGPNVVKSVNVMVVKIVDKSDPTNVMCALIRLLHESLATDSSSQRYMELIMKCLWKMVRMLPSIIGTLNMDMIIGELHQFLKAYPSHTWKKRSSDVPLRTIKTILHSMAKLKGNKIMGHLSLVDTSNSEIEAYINKVLSSGAIKNDQQQQQQEHVNGNAENNEPQMTPVRRDPPTTRTPSSRKKTKSTHDMLAEIFKKIGAKENTKEGLNDLYDFKLQYPDADLDPFLKKSSPFFQSYIERGLKAIADDRDGDTKYSTRSEPAMSNSNSANSLSSVNSAPATNADDYEVDVDHFRDRLKALCAKCGLDNNQLDTNTSHEPLKSALLSQVKAQDSGSNSSLSSNSSLGTSMPNLGSSLPLSAAQQENIDEHAASVLDLKKRLERIKSSMK